MEYNLCDILERQDGIGGGRKEVTMLYVYDAEHKLKHIFDICKGFRLL